MVGDVMNPGPTALEVQQVNCFYNYTAGLEVGDVDLIKTAVRLLRSGVARAVCFSDLKSFYLDTNGDIQLEWIQPKGRQWDSSWMVQFSDDLPRPIAEELLFCLELSFHEQRIEGAESRQIPPHLRAVLPPVVLERGDFTLPVYPWLKVYSDGILNVSFQLDTTWDSLNEADFISDVVNLFYRYFDQIWIQANVQRLDANHILPEAFAGDLSIAGQAAAGRKHRRLLKDLHRASRVVLDRSLGKDGRNFEVGGDSWTLHQIAGSEGDSDWEANIDLCRSIYLGAVTSLIVPSAGKKAERFRRVQLWQGHPSISLMRFTAQPDTTDGLVERFSPTISPVLMRSSSIEQPPDLPPDLRLFEDYCLHGNQALLLWT